jgi:excinuclease ABC subunit C
MFNLRGGRIMGSRSWIIDRKEFLEDEGYLGAALAKIYQESAAPKEIYVNELLAKDSEITVLAQWLSENSKSKISISIPARGEKFELMQTVARNAHEALVQYLSKRANDAAVSGAALEEVSEYLSLRELPLRIECFDISNTQGSNMVASMVVFEDGRPKKSDYRRFAIDDNEIYDDTRAMRDVITRRFKRYLQEKEIDQNEVREAGGTANKFAYPPQLIVVDGGSPQVNSAFKALADLGINDIPVVGLAKRLEEVWLPNNPDPIIFPRHAEGLYLLQRVRDEAHRFAITYHRSKRSKVMLESALDEVDGLGEARRKALLENFGSLAMIRKAEASDLAKIPGIGDRLANQIYSTLHKQEPTQ